jgi:superfamily II DNA/RNA helicase
MGKSFIMEVFIKNKIQNGARCNFARIVPTKALINEVREDTVKGLDKLLEEMNYSVITAASDYSLEEDHNFILVMTPERLLYLLISKPDFKIDYIFIDEAHKMTGRNSRGPFYYKTVDMLAQQDPPPHFIFASPNIPNPEVYLKLVTEAQKGAENAISSTFAPVTQFKFLISQETKSIRIFNDHTQDTIFICKYGNASMSVVDFMNIMTAFDQDKPLGERKRNIAYFSGKNGAIEAARAFAKGKDDIDDEDLKQLANDIRDQVHGDYYLTKLIRKGIAYHIGYLPASIRQRIEKLFKAGKITAMFCTSTLIEGVNLPADNLFITNYRSGRPQMTSVEFRNLIGRVGRIKFNLYGNVFFISDGNQVTEKEYVRLLREPIPEQKLSIVQELKPKLKKHVVDTLLSGSSKIEPYDTKSQKQSEEEYVMMRKFGLILLKDIMDDRNSLVRREFAAFMPEGGEEIIREKFTGQKEFIDSDINISADQTRKLAAAIRNGTHYPKSQDGRFSHSVVLGFLEELSRIFNWDKYEFGTLGKRNKVGEHAKLSWYAVILSQWMEGHGLSYIMRKAIDYMNEHPEKFWLNEYTPSYFDDSPEHRNVVFADTLEVIENVILFSISNYFLRFSNMYIAINGEHSLDDNNWYEFVEYGTTNEITVFLQRNGFSRESANYIKDHPEYIFRQDGVLMLRRSLLKCKNNDARTEAELISLNRPKLFEEE